MTYKTTRKDEDYFEARVRHWLAVLSLGDWKVDVYRKGLVDMSAACEMWHDAHGAHITINEEFAYQPAKPWLDRLALHEVGHVLLCDLKRLIKDRKCKKVLLGKRFHRGYDHTEDVYAFDCGQGEDALREEAKKQGRL